MQYESLVGLVSARCRESNTDIYKIASKYGWTFASAFGLITGEMEPSLQMLADLAEELAIEPQKLTEAIRLGF